MSETILVKEKGTTSVSATYSVTDSPKTFIFSGSAGANVMVYLNGALVATLSKSSPSYVALSTGEYTLVTTSNECAAATVLAEDYLSGGAPSEGEAQFAKEICLSDGSVATKYYDVTEEGEVLYGYTLSDGDFVESLDGLTTTSESEFDYYEPEFGFTLDSGVTRAISFYGTEIIAAGQSGTITVDDDAVATVTESLKESYPTICNITVTASVGTVDDDEHTAFTGLRVFVRVCKNSDQPYFPVNPSAMTLTSTNGETQTSYYVGFGTGSPCDCISNITETDCAADAGLSCDAPLYEQVCNPEAISDPVVAAIEAYAVISSTEIQVYDTNGNVILVTAEHNAGTNVTTYYDAEGNTLTLGTDFTLEEPTVSTSMVLQEVDDSGNATGVLVVVTIDSEGNRTYVNLSDGSTYTLPTDYSLKTAEDNDYQILAINGCDSGTSIQRISVLQNGVFFGSYVINATTGAVHTLSGNEIWGALCDEAGTSCDSPLYESLCNPEDISDPIVTVLNSLLTTLSTQALQGVTSTEMVVYSPTTYEEMLVTAKFDPTTNITTYYLADGTVVVEGTNFVTTQVATPDGADIADNTTVTLSDITGVDSIKTFTIVRDYEDGTDPTAGDVTVTTKSGNTLTLKAAGTRTWGTGDGSGYIDPTSITITTLESSASVIWEAI